MTGSAIRIVTLVNVETGTFGPVISGTEEDILPLLSSPFVDGVFDATTQQMDPASGQIIAREPRAPMIHELRQARNELLDAWRWTVMPDSPLSKANQADWLDWLREMQACLRDVGPDQTAGFIFPARPQLVYADGGAA